MPYTAFGEELNDLGFTKNHMDFKIRVDSRKKVNKPVELHSFHEYFQAKELVRRGNIENDAQTVNWPDELNELNLRVYLFEKKHSIKFTECCIVHYLLNDTETRMLKDYILSLYGKKFFEVVFSERLITRMPENKKVVEVKMSYLS